MDHILKQQQNELSTIDALLLLNLIIIHQKARHASYVSSFITGSYASFSRKRIATNKLITIQLFYLIKLIRLIKTQSIHLPIYS
jgi:hypothetical protein